MDSFVSTGSRRYTLSGEKWKRSLDDHSPSQKGRPAKRQKRDENQIVHTMQFKCVLPCYLREDYIRRHKLSESDVAAMLKHTDPRTLWMAGFLSGTSVNGSVIHQSQSLNETKVLCSEGAKIKSHVLAKFKKDGIISDDQSPKCIAAGGRYTTPLHLLKRSEMAKMVAVLAQEVKKVIQWNGIDVLPVCWSNGYLEVKRVVPRAKFVQLLGEVKSEMQRPFDQMTEKGVWVEMDEHFLVQTSEQHNRLLEIEKKDGLKGLSLIGQTPCI